MAGNSKRRGAMRKEGTKKGMVVGSGGQRRRALQGKGPTPPAEMRPGHPAARRAARAVTAKAKQGGRAGDKRRPGDGETPETVLGRNPVVECLRAGVPATALHVALGTHADELLEAASESAEPGLIVALDGVTDPRNLGAVVRSVGAFGGHGVVVPQRRAAGLAAVAGGPSARAAARVPVAPAPHLT